MRILVFGPSDKVFLKLILVSDDGRRSNKLSPEAIAEDSVFSLLQEEKNRTARIKMNICNLGIINPKYKKSRQIAGFLIYYIKNYLELIS